MESSRDMLLEIGAEELPASFVEAALAALPELAKKRFSALRLSHGEVRALGTPRRLALLVTALATKQTELEEVVQGPSASAAFDKEGKPTRAAEAFAKKLGVEVSALTTVETPKGKYLSGTRREAARETKELLGEMLGALIAEIPFRKSMRWGSRDETFGRPIRWLVALFGTETVDVSFANVTSGRTTFGHRFLAPAAIDVRSPDAYVDTLRKAHVLVDPKERADRMIERLHEAAKAAGCTLIEDDFLVGENLSLVEEPHVITGSYEARFLGLPEEVILEVARGHQRYFGVRDAQGKLAPKYLAVVNTALRPDLIVRGNDRTMRARLSDAQFFFDEDKKIELSARAKKLDGIVFHVKLGSVGAKAARVKKLTEKLAQKLSLSADVAARASRGAELAKCDLVTLMVGEFPELQGVMGRAYALAQGEPAAVADVIRDHYLPKGGKDAPAAADESALVSVADRLDSLVGCFAVGLVPTGAADPYGLRRACLGVLRTLLARGWDLSIDALVRLAYAGYVEQDVKLGLSQDETAQKLEGFVRERLRNLLADALPGDVVDACLAVAADRPLDARARAEALVKLDADVRAKVGEVFKRVANIAKDAPDGEPRDPKELETAPHAAESQLFSALVALEVLGPFREGSDDRDYAGAFAAIAALAPTLAEYFLNVFVMAEDAALKDNRLRTMRAVRDACSRVAHFQLLQG